MSEYYLADQRARERADKRNQQGEPPASPQSQDVKVTLLGDFLFSSGESQGFDPYNSVHGKAPRDLWRGTRGRGA
jgi:hypothetical protein